jgi:hypothetical protein
VTARQRALWAVRRNPPPGWAALFAYATPTGTRVRCLLCGSTGHGPCGRMTGTPAPWQARCLLGHTARCETCRRPFANRTALAGHQNCKSHHACCTEHTTVPEWANPFRRAS